MEALNDALFLLLNAPAHPDALELALARLFAVWAIWLVPLVLTAGWLRGSRRTRTLMLEAAASGLAGMLANQVIGLVWRHPRPFMVGLGHTYLAHAPDSSFPSDHATLLWAVSLSLLAHRRTRLAGAVLTVLGLPLAWARVYLGVHFPLDMAGAALVACFCAWLCLHEEHRGIEPAALRLEALFRRCFAPLLERGWIVLR
ncbi:MAG: undecaprenyl-diphosphatase [Humidesulfovibrio sp.]|nr:undecaprenyl-diphosphatase [Humidesulfovibrio sp.]